MAYQHEAINADDDAVTKLYGVRTVETSCAYLLPYITKKSNILDVGCGPGTITTDLAALAPGGQTVGTDISAGVIDQARQLSSKLQLPNLKFEVDDAAKLPYEANSFDIVHAHQLLLHAPSPLPLTILSEFHRICRPGGLIALRESSPAVITSLVPDLPLIRAYWERAMKTMVAMGGHTTGGRELEGWVREAGLVGKGDVDGDGKKGKLVVMKGELRNPSHLHRVVGEEAETVVKYGLATREEVDAWAGAWRGWEAFEGAEFVFEAGEVLCWKGE